MIARLAGAIQFLTIIPIRGGGSSLGSSALFFPLVGAGLGATGGGILEVSRGYLPFSLVCLLVLVFWILITGGLHEDGFADCADALRAWRTPEKMLAIMKDSRVGAHGALALILLVLVRWEALSAIAVAEPAALTAALALGRTAIVALLWCAPPAGSGSAVAASASLSTATALLAMAQGAAFALLSGGRLASLLLGGATAIVLLSRRYFVARIGGVTGDCLGATALVVETWCFIVFTCRPCT
ncbi:MAG TPA: adenosylcobinamide-GDP ribazoletransferase [Bryobacteraceae bacterium]|nr:adenosylcobinamide-GDP ribazoletransferase [Bryobacteraceae bacterium]